MAAGVSRRTRALTSARISGRRPLGLPAFRGFHGLGQRRVGEKKVIDHAVAGYLANTTGSITLLNGCILGSDYNNRIGRKIVVRSLYIRGYVVCDPTVTAGVGSSPAQLARLIVFIDNQPNGTTPAVTDLLVSAHASSQLNLDNRDRFRVVADSTFPMGPLVMLSTTTGYADQAVKDVNCYKKLSLETIYNAGNAGTIGDIASGALYMLWVGTVVAGSDCAASVSARVRFSDP